MCELVSAALGMYGPLLYGQLRPLDCGIGTLKKQSRQTKLRNCKAHGLFPDFSPCFPIALVLREASGLWWELEARGYPHQVSISLGGTPGSKMPLQSLGIQAKARLYHFGTLFHRQLFRAGHSLLKVTQLRMGIDLSILPGLV